MCQTTRVTLYVVLRKMMVASQETQTWRRCQRGCYVGDHHHELLYQRVVVVVPLVRNHRPNYVEHGNVEDVLGKYASLELGLLSLPTIREWFPICGKD